MSTKQNSAGQWFPTRQSLLSRLKHHSDDESWEDFFNSYWKLIYSVAKKSGLNDHDAQEVVQETLITVSKQMPGFKYDRSKGSFKSWLCNTTRWRIMDQKRKHLKLSKIQGEETSNSQALAVENEANDPELESIWQKEWEENLINLAMDRVRNQVNPRDLQVFDLCTVKGWPAAKVAQTLGFIRPQIYYVNKKVTGLLKEAMEKLNAEMDDRSSKFR